MTAQKPRRTTVADVARLAGVSAMTVSNVLNAPHRVAPPTVQTVRAAIQELGYIPNHAARALSSGRSQVIGLPLYFEDEPDDDPDNPGLGGFLHGLLGGLVKAAAVSGYGVHVTTPTEGAPGTTAEIALYEKLIAARQVDAIVVLETMPHDERIEFLSRRRFPFVAFGRTGPEHRQCWVDVDNESSMAGVAAHLRSTGRERAVYLATDSPLPWVHQRRDGFVREFPSTVARSFGSLEAVAAYVEELDPPDVFVADNDAFAVVAMRTLQRRGIAVGQDVAVTGFNDFPFASMLDTPLTTARIPLRDIAACLFDRALREISGEPDEPGRLVTAPLVIRSSA
ncbi:LacI family DNA-binding transcriptional regulator [Kribbella sp. NPDC055110]